MKKPLRAYYERNNFLVQQYCYVDRLLDSSLPQNLVEEYGIAVPETIHEESAQDLSDGSSSSNSNPVRQPTSKGAVKVERTKAIFKVQQDEETPLLTSKDGTEEFEASPSVPMFEFDDDADSQGKVVIFAIYLNFAANAILLVLKIIVTVLTDSLSVLASLVDAALDFLSTMIIWTTSRLIAGSKSDLENYPVGRQR